MEKNYQYQAKEFSPLVRNVALVNGLNPDELNRNWTTISREPQKSFVSVPIIPVEASTRDHSDGLITEEISGQEQPQQPRIGIGDKLREGFGKLRRKIGLPLSELQDKWPFRNKRTSEETTEPSVPAEELKEGDIHGWSERYHNTRYDQNTELGRKWRRIGRLDDDIRYTEDADLRELGQHLINYGDAYYAIIIDEDDPYKKESSKDFVRIANRLLDNREKLISFYGEEYRQVVDEMKFKMLIVVRRKLIDRFGYIEEKSNKATEQQTKQPKEILGDRVYDYCVVAGVDPNKVVADMYRYGIVKAEVPRTDEGGVLPKPQEAAPPVETASTKKPILEKVTSWLKARIPRPVRKSPELIEETDLPGGQVLPYEITPLPISSLSAAEIPVGRKEEERDENDPFEPRNWEELMNRVSGEDIIKMWSIADTLKMENKVSESDHLDSFQNLSYKYPKPASRTEEVSDLHRRINSLADLLREIPPFDSEGRRKFSDEHKEEIEGLMREALVDLRRRYQTDGKEGNVEQPPVVTPTQPEQEIRISAPQFDPDRVIEESHGEEEPPDWLQQLRDATEAGQEVTQPSVPEPGHRQQVEPAPTEVAEKIVEPPLPGQIETQPLVKQPVAADTQKGIQSQAETGPLEPVVENMEQIRKAAEFADKFLDEGSGIVEGPRLKEQIKGVENGAEIIDRVIEIADNIDNYIAQLESEKEKLGSSEREILRHLKYIKDNRRRSYNTHDVAADCIEYLSGLPGRLNAEERSAAYRMAGLISHNSRHSSVDLPEGVDRFEVTKAILRKIREQFNEDVQTAQETEPDSGVPEEKIPPELAPPIVATETITAGEELKGLARQALSESSNITSPEVIQTLKEKGVGVSVINQVIDLIEHIDMYKLDEIPTDSSDVNYALSMLKAIKVSTSRKLTKGEIGQLITHTITLKHLDENEAQKMKNLRAVFLDGTKAQICEIPEGADRLDFVKNMMIVLREQFDEEVGVTQSNSGVPEEPEEKIPPEPIQGQQVEPATVAEKAEITSSERISVEDREELPEQGPKGQPEAGPAEPPKETSKEISGSGVEAMIERSLKANIVERLKAIDDAGDILGGAVSLLERYMQDPSVVSSDQEEVINKIKIAQRMLIPAKLEGLLKTSVGPEQQKNAADLAAILQGAWRKEFRELEGEYDNLNLLLEAVNYVKKNLSSK